MPTNLTTLTAEQLAERAAACMGWVRGGLGNGYWIRPDDTTCGPWTVIGYRDYDIPEYSPATDEAQAAELMRHAVAAWGAAEFARELLSIKPDWAQEPDDIAGWLATADARARTCAAVACLESTDPKPDNERGE